MRLVYRFDMKHDDRIAVLCRVSKNLYNQSLYAVKQELHEHNKWLGYKQLDALMKNTVNLEGEINYRLLKAQVAQQCLRTLDKNIKSYVKSIKDYAKHPEKYKGKPRFPRYKRDFNQLIYPNQSCSIKDGMLNLAKGFSIPIPQYEKYADRLKSFQQARILPKLDGSFTVEIVYVDRTAVNTDLDRSSYASIDLGVDNLATLVLPNDQPLLFNGRPLKSRNRYFNKTISKLKSELTNGQRTSKRIRRLYVRRENQIKDMFHKISRKIVNTLISNKVGNIVVGYNKGWKDSVNLGKRNNQTFVQIPYAELAGFIKYKCGMCGINCVVSEEGYTSKCDSLALEPVEKHEEYAGRRVKRGLFRSSVGKLINADVNGALNIMRKVVGDSGIVSRIIDSGLLFRPLRIDVLQC